MAHHARQIVRATRRAYENAIADGADEDAAYKAACAIYRFGYPRADERVLRHVVAVVVGRPPPTRPAAKKPKRNREAVVSGAGATHKRAVAAARRAYINSIANGVTAPAAFKAAKVAFRARHPELSGERLDAAVARALASNTNG